MCWCLVEIYFRSFIFSGHMIMTSRNRYSFTHDFIQPVNRRKSLRKTISKLSKTWWMIISCIFFEIGRNITKYLLRSTNIKHWWIKLWNRWEIEKSIFKRNFYKLYVGFWIIMILCFLFNWHGHFMYISNTLNDYHVIFDRNYLKHVFFMFRWMSVWYRAISSLYSIILTQPRA